MHSKIYDFEVGFRVLLFRMCQGLGLTGFRTFDPGVLRVSGQVYLGSSLN